MGAERDERPALPCRAIEHGDLMPGPNEIGRHRRAHTSKSDKSKFHASISS